MNGEKEFRLPFGDWADLYISVTCLKKTNMRETWLLREKEGTECYILKKASGEQADFLEMESGILGELSRGTELPQYQAEFRRKNGEGFLLRRYVEGITLDKLVKQEGALDTEEAAEIVIKLCKSIALLHNRKPPVIHRDIKPENVVLTPSGRVKLIDFETARQYKEGQEEDTFRMGTRGYAAPEQFGFGQTDKRTDIYAVGKIFFYLLTGECEAEIKYPEKNIGRCLKKTLEKCCAYNPDERYQEAEELIKELERVKNMGSGAQRKSKILGAACAALLVISLALGFGLWKESSLMGNRAERIAYEGAAWNPDLYEGDMKEIILAVQKEDSERTAEKCEELVRKLGEAEAVSGVEPVAYWKLSEEELAEYNNSRLGKEYIADRLAYQDALITRRLGEYSLYQDKIVMEIRMKIEYTWTGSDGSEQGSALRGYAVNGENMNVDGCVIELLDCLNRALPE